MRIVVEICRTSSRTAFILVEGNKTLPELKELAEEKARTYNFNLEKEGLIGYEVTGVEVLKL